MNEFLNKMERKFGRFAISDLIRYMVAVYCLGAALGFASEMGMIDPNFYYNYLALNMERVFHGQVWRLFTYLLECAFFLYQGEFVFPVWQVAGAGLGNFSVQFIHPHWIFAEYCGGVNHVPVASSL